MVESLLLGKEGAMEKKDSLRQKRTSPWPEITEEEIADEAQRFRDLRIRLGFIFQDAQQEAYEQWCRWDEAMGGEEKEQSS